LRRRAHAVTADTVAIFPYCGAETLDSDYCKRVGDLLVALLEKATREGRLEPRDGLVAELRDASFERALTMEQLFTFAYLTERTALDEVALSDSIGATSEPWPLVAQLIRRASFDMLAAYAEHLQLEPTDNAITDPLTTLHTRPLFEAVLSKELERATRFGYAVALILFDVDRLSTINKAHGYGVGDKILERLGIMLREDFPQHDWGARDSGGSFPGLLAGRGGVARAGVPGKPGPPGERRPGFHRH